MIHHLLLYILGGFALGIALAWMADDGARGAVIFALLATSFLALVFHTDKENRP